MMRVIALVLLTAAGGAVGEDTGGSAHRGFVDHVYRDDQGEHKYVVFVPLGEPPQDGWPVILFLHGAGERGTDGQRQLSVGLGPLVKLRSDTFPAVVVFPQAENFDRPILRTWSPHSVDGRRAVRILTEVEAAYPINPSQRILSGWSMGAVGAWSLATADPDHWSAVVAVSGGGPPSAAPKLTGVPIWAFHGTDDRIVPVSSTQKIVQAVRDAGGTILLSEIELEGHDVWRRVYDSEVVLDWMLHPNAGRQELESIELPEDRTRTEEAPFVPALIVERAMTARLGQEAVDIIATGMPSSLEPDALSGTLDDVSEELELEGRTLDVRFGELTYVAKLERAVIRAYAADRVQAEVGLRNVRLHVGRIAVSDGSVGFTAGPAEVVVGHREPVWLRLEVRPAVVEQRLALKLLRSSFEIPGFNWYVREPEGIRLQGDWLTEEEVKTAVVGGIYVRRETIEEQVLSAVPQMLDKFSEEVDLSPLEGMVEALWPLPVYRPDVRVAPESIAADARGVSVTFSVVVAAVDPTKKQPVERVRASGPAAYAVARTTDLRVGIAVDALDHISSLLAGTEAARIFTTDIPDQPFVELTDPEALASVLPHLASLSSGVEVQTALMLEEPLHVRPLEARQEAGRTSLGLVINAPRLAMQVSTVGAAPLQQPAPSRSTVPGPPATGEPDSGVAINAGAPAAVPRAELPASPLRSAENPENAVAIEPVFDAVLSLKQPLSLQAVTLEHGRTGLRVVWESDADISASVGNAGAGDPRDRQNSADATAELFRRGWKRWTAAQGEQTAALPDVALGSASMSLHELAWEGDCLSARFAPAATRITNATDTSLTYQVRGPYSGWSEARTLAAGAATSFATGTEIHLRPLRHWEFDAVVLPAGSVWECRSEDSRSKPQWFRMDDRRLPSSIDTDPAEVHP